jgi:hypothetical protein
MVVTGQPFVALGLTTVVPTPAYFAGGDRAVVGRECELGIRHGGKRQEQQQNKLSYGVPPFRITKEI